MKCYFLVGLVPLIACQPGQAVSDKLEDFTDESEDVDTDEETDTGDSEDTGSDTDPVDTSTPQEGDTDGDGFTPEQGDCDDSDASVNPDALDIFCHALFYEMDHIWAVAKGGSAKGGFQCPSGPDLQQ